MAKLAISKLLCWKTVHCAPFQFGQIANIVNFATPNSQILKILSPKVYKMDDIFRNQSKYTTMRGFLCAEEWANYAG